MSRADYLSKYLLGGGGKDKKKKKKSHQKDSSSERGKLNIVVNAPSIVDDTGEASEEEEETPITLDPQTNVKENKGFKRIDTGAIVGDDSRSARDSNSATYSSSTSGLALAEKPPEQRTVYRDKSGRIIDIHARRAEVAEQAKDKADREKNRLLMLNQGELQKIEDEEQRARESVLKKLGTNLSQYIQQLREEKLKTASHFDDPMTAFADNTALLSGTRSKTGRFHYTKGVGPVNRYNIKPGFFWDGIDRSNGFEELAVRKRNEQSYSKLTANDFYEANEDI